MALSFSLTLITRHFVVTNVGVSIIYAAFAFGVALNVPTTVITLSEILSILFVSKVLSGNITDKVGLLVIAGMSVLAKSSRVII